MKPSKRPPFDAKPGPRPWLCASACAGLPRFMWQAVRWKYLRGGWFRDYFWRHDAFRLDRLKCDQPVDIIVLIVDHFEPADSGVQAAADSVSEWCDDYARIASRHRDADGRMPQHTWFYRAEYPNQNCLAALNRAVMEGFGEVEFHLHHGHDSHESFSKKLRDGLDFFNRSGAMLTAEPVPRQRFAYIAGNWALDNGAGDSALSGCDSELRALREAGCYADYTFPALGSRAQPRISNSIYYATEDDAPKSYDRGIRAGVNRRPSGDLMIFQGPSTVDWQRGRFEDAALESFDTQTAGRLDCWLDAHVHVEGRPEWVFIKLHTHGMQNRSAFLSPELDHLFATMTARWNRPPYRLHFATAREAFNMVRAAEAGKTGNPGHYRDFEILPPANRFFRASLPWRLRRADPRRLCIDVLDSYAVGSFRFADPSLPSLEGRLRTIQVHHDVAGAAVLDIEGDVEVGPKWLPVDYAPCPGSRRWVPASGVVPLTSNSSYRP